MAEATFFPLLQYDAINLKIVQLLCTILRFYTRMFCTQNGIINRRLNGYPFSRFYLLGQEKGGNDEHSC